MSVVKAICRVMDRIAPLKFAEKWDNVGLLLEAPIVRPNANRILLTIDLTTEVAEEALSTPTCCIVTYHPTIFKPLSSFTLANPLQKSLLRCAAAGISVYSPHSALDSVTDGINDWLTFVVASGMKSEVANIGETFEDGQGGQGRVITLDDPIPMRALEASVKLGLGLQHIQVGYPAGYNPQEAKVKTVAVGAGAAGSLVAASKADAWLTGEMSHHEVLAAVAAGHCVILAGHTNTERGYLSILARKLSQGLQAEAAGLKDKGQAGVLAGLSVRISEKDKHPLQIV